MPLCTVLIDDEHLTRCLYFAIHLVTGWGPPDKEDDVFGEQLLGSSDWPDFEGDPAFKVPPKAMPELYASQGDQVRAVDCEDYLPCFVLGG